MQLRETTDGRWEVVFEVHPRVVQIAAARGETVSDWYALRVESDDEREAQSDLVDPWFADWNDAEFACELFDNAWFRLYRHGASPWDDEVAKTEREARTQLEEFLRTPDNWPDGLSADDEAALRNAFEAALRHDGRGCRDALRGPLARWAAEFRTPNS